MPEPDLDDDGTTARAKDIERPSRSSRTLRTVQQLSALPIAAFLFLHLASPVCAAFAPPTLISSESIANDLMLAARELYQTLAGEWLLFGSAAVHVLSGLAQRVQRTLKASRRGTSLPPPPPLHIKAGYALLPIAGLHVYLHRVLPSSDWMSFSFVGYALGGGGGSQSQSRSAGTSVSRLGRALNLAAYGSLISIASYHVLVGMKVIVKPMDARKLDGRPKWKAAYVGLVGSVGVGLARIATSMERTPDWIAVKYVDVLRKTWMS